LPVSDSHISKTRASNSMGFSTFFYLKQAELLVSFLKITQYPL